MMGDRIGIPRLGRLDDAIMSSNAPKRHLGKPVVMVKQRGDAFIYRLATLYIYEFASNKVQVVHTKKARQKLMLAFLLTSKHKNMISLHC